MNKVLRATLALGMFIAFAASAAPEGRIQLTGQVLVPAACRAESGSIRKPGDFKLSCRMNADGTLATPVHSVFVHAISGSQTAYLVQITYL